MFQIHPNDLAKRRRRCAPVVERLSHYQRTTANYCNICGACETAILSTRDRYGFPGRAGMCLSCGLIYNLDRFTAPGYADFYERGAYRQLIGKFKNVEQNLERIQAGQIGYAKNLLQTFGGIFPEDPRGRLLDIGGSTGLVSQEFQKQLGYRPTIVEPSAAEAAMARSLGLDAVVGSIETWQTDHNFDVILLCRTVEHLYDLKLALTKIRSLLKPTGLFYCDLADFLEIVRREGPPEATAKVDHVYWLTQETAPPIFRSLGFEVASMQLTLPPDQVGFLLRAADRQPLKSVSPGWIHEQLRRFRQIQTNWQQFGSRPRGIKDWLHQQARRLKRRLTS